MSKNMEYVAPEARLICFIPLEDISEELDHQGFIEDFSGGPAFGAGSGGGTGEVPID